MKQLQEERHQFEKHITDVLGQQEALLKEREGEAMYGNIPCDEHNRSRGCSKPRSSLQTAGLPLLLSLFKLLIYCSNNWLQHPLLLYTLCCQEYRHSCWRVRLYSCVTSSW